MKSFFASLFVLVSVLAFGQDDLDSYFQQEVDYKISVELDTATNKLLGDLELEYTNYSPEPLSEIYFHLWMNSHASKNSDFATQLVENGSREFFMADEDRRGSITGLEFSIEYWENEADSIQVETNSNQPEILKLVLDKPLQTGERVIIKTPFVTELPDVFSRPGVADDIFHVTQWYPKPAVYDQDGWHLMPYLDQGEFYAEFGRFEVNITVPAGLVVAATGELRSPQESDWLQQLEQATRAGISNNYSFEKAQSLKDRSGTKLLTFVQDNIHDFAWFASTDFLYLQKPVLIGEDVVAARAFFREADVFNWERATNYIASGLQSYSEKIGEYPYSHCTAVGGALGAGGGMEYPMITIIGPTNNDLALKTVIIHEVGHNWFQGMLATNERTSPWLDEGINSLYEEWALADEVGVEKLDFEFPKLAYSLSVSRHTNQPIQESSENYLPLNYYADVYGAGAFAMNYLKEYLGTETFNKGMQDYFQNWKFKHPGNKELQTSLEKAAQKDLSWFFTDLIYAEQPFDYSMKSLDGMSATIHNSSLIAAPFTLSYLSKEGEVLETNWHEGFTGTQSVQLTKSPDQYHTLKIFQREIFPETNRRNNEIKTKGLFPKSQPVKLVGPKSPQSVLAGKSDQPLLYVVPGIGWNTTDKIMAGINLSNTMVFERPFEYSISAGYGFGSQDIIGMGEAAYSFYPKKTSPFQRIKVSTGGRHFNYGEFQEIDLDYYQATPKLEFQFRKPAVRNPIKKTISLQSRVNIIEPRPSFDPMTGELIEFDLETEVYNTLEFKRENKREFNPNTARLWVEQNENFGKLSGEYKYRYDFAKENRHVWFRAFAGTMLYTEDEAPTISRFTAMSRYNYTDYSLSELYMDRNEASYQNGRFFYPTVETNNLYNNQLYISDGGLKVKRLGANLADVTGEWMAATNLEVSLPFQLPIGDLQAFGDIAVFQDLGITGPEETRALYDAGISYGIGDFVRLYYPLAISNEFKPDFGDLTFADKLTFTLQLNPTEFRDKIREQF